MILIGGKIGQKSHHPSKWSGPATPHTADRQPVQKPPHIVNNQFR